MYKSENKNRQRLTEKLIGSVVIRVGHLVQVGERLGRVVFEYAVVIVHISILLGTRNANQSRVNTNGRIFIILYLLIIGGKYLNIKNMKSPT